MTVEIVEPLLVGRDDWLVYVSRDQCTKCHPSRHLLLRERVQGDALTHYHGSNQCLCVALDLAHPALIAVTADTFGADIYVVGTPSHRADIAAPLMLDRAQQGLCSRVPEDEIGNPSRNNVLPSNWTSPAEYAGSAAAHAHGGAP